MDELRTWLVRLIAPLAFILAAVVLVVVIERALEDSSSSSASPEPAPVVSESVPAESETLPETVPLEEQFYRIRAGDTLEAISQQFGTSVERLLELNPGIDPLALSPGRRIRVA
jgi:LysM repeat protein